MHPACSTISARVVSIALKHVPEQLDLADVNCAMANRDEDPVANTQTIRCRWYLVEVGFIQGGNELGAPISHFLNPLDHIANGVNRLTDVVNGTPVDTEDLVLWRNDLSFNPLNDLGNVGPFSMGDVRSMPKHAKGILIRNPEKLLLVQTTDFVQRMGIPESPVCPRISVHPVGEVIPL